LDERHRLLVLENAEGKYELPGGGWEHNETLEECLRREIKEELGVEVLWVGALWLSYRGKRPRRPWFLRLCLPVLLESNDFTLGSGMRNAYFVNRQTFLNTAFASDEEPIKKLVDDIWLPKSAQRLKKTA
jgi:8-oxo-dGTP pyrophosphatase MutT (NUDIX family)